MAYTLRLFFSSKCSLFHNSNVFVSCIIHILYTGVLKLKKNNSGAKRLTSFLPIVFGVLDFLRLLLGCTRKWVKGKKNNT